MAGTILKAVYEWNHEWNALVADATSTTVVARMTYIHHSHETYLPFTPHETHKYLARNKHSAHGKHTYRSLYMKQTKSSLVTTMLLIGNTPITHSFSNTPLVHINYTYRWLQIRSTYHQNEAHPTLTSKTPMAQINHTYCSIHQKYVYPSISYWKCQV